MGLIVLGTWTRAQTPPNDPAAYARWKAQWVAQTKSTKNEILNISNDFIRLGCGSDGCFGIKTTGGNPDIEEDDNKLLTYSTYGSTNGLAVKIGDTVYVLSDDSTYVTTPMEAIEDGTAARMVWTIDGVTLTARYEIVNSDTGNPDTARVTYTFTNAAKAETRSIGLKVGLDTMIGGNDAARLATASGIVATETGFGVDGAGGSYDNPVPDFWQAFEEDDLADPGLVGQGTFTGVVKDALVRPDKFVVGRWNEVSSGYTFDFAPTGEAYGDSAVGMWWFDKSLPPGESLSFAVFYGLGQVTTHIGDLSMGVSAPASLAANGANFDPNPFTVLVQLQNHTGMDLTDVPVSLSLPSGLSVADGGSTTETIASLRNGADQAISFMVLASPASAGSVLTYTVTAAARETYEASLEKTISLPALEEAPGFVHVMGVGFPNADDFPTITATVRVDTDCGRDCDLGIDDFAVIEDGVEQTLTSVTCASESGSVADIVFVFDDTASMGSQIATMKTKATAFADDIVAAGVDARFGLVSFGDKAEVDFDLDLTASVPTFQAAVNALTASGGNDVPEAALDGVMRGIDDMSWREGAQRIFILITDAPTHYRDDGTGLSDYNMDETIAAVNGIRGAVFAVGPNLTKHLLVGNDGKTRDTKAYGDDNDVRTLAEDTGGFWQDMSTADFSTFVDQIVDIVTSLYTVTYTTNNPARDGTDRDVQITAADCDGTTSMDHDAYTAPAGGCPADAGDFLHIMSVGFSGSDPFPTITATVRVDTETGRACELGIDDFSATEDAVTQTLTSVTCAASGGSVADIAIVFDDTGSMASQIGTMQAKATAFADAIVADGVDARFGLVSFADNTGLDFDLDLTNDVPAFQRAVNALRAAGGGDTPEAALDGVMLAVTRMSWRAGSQRIIVLITDAPTHYAGDGTTLSSYTMDETIAAVNGLGATVFAVGPDRSKGVLVGNDGTSLSSKAYGDANDVRTLAEDTGGFWQNITTADFGEFIDDIVDVVTSLYTLVYTTTNDARDGTLRHVTVGVVDPVEGPGCDEGSYTAPLDEVDCDHGDGDFAYVMGVGYAETAIFPQITATVRVNSEAGRECALTRTNFGLTEDGVVQNILSATCASTAGSVADVVIVFDDTGSMSSQINTMREKAAAFVNDISAAGVDAYFGLVSFKDKADVDLDLDLTPSVDEFQTALDALSAAGGGDTPEAALDGVMRAVNDMSWRAGSQRILVVITDAPTHYLDDGSGLSDVSMADTIAAVRALGASVFAVGPDRSKGVLVGNDGNSLSIKAYGDDDDVRTLAEDTGGFWQNITTADFGEFIDEIVDVVTSLYTIVYRTSNAALDGTLRHVVISVTDPAEGTDCDDGTYTAPAAEAILEVAPTSLAAVCRTGTSPADDRFQVRNAGVGAMSFTVSESIPWLEVSPTVGVSSGSWEDVDVMYDASGLAEGVYTGTITVSAAGTAVDVDVTLTVLDMLVDRDFDDGCHSPGDVVDVTLTIDFGGAGTVTSLAVFEDLPPGWTYLGVTSTPGPAVEHFDAATDQVEFGWITIPELPHTVVYQVRVPEDEVHDTFCFDGHVNYRTGGAEKTVPSYGETCMEVGECCVPHDADQNGDWTIDLTPELLRLVQFYNVRGYHCQAGTEDDYAPGVGATYAAPHRADQNGDWVIQLSPELTRLIQFYNSGGYHCQTGTEDGYAPGRTTMVKGSMPKEGTLTATRSFAPERYTSGDTVDVTVTITHDNPDAITALAVTEDLPAGWTFDQILSTPAPPIAPASGASGTLGFAWLSIPTTWPMVFTYRVHVPADAVGIKSFTGFVSYREMGGSIDVTTPATDIAPNTHTVTFVSGANGAIIGDTPQIVAHGENAAPVTARANFGFVFDHWDDGNTDNPRTYGPVLDNTTRTALFRVANDVPPVGTFGAIVDAAGVALGHGIWDLSGHYTTVIDGKDLTLDLLHDGKGKITGTGTYNVPGVGDIPLVVKGSGKGKAGILMVKLGLKGVLGANKLAMKMTLQLNPAEARLEGVTALKGALDGAKIKVTDDDTILHVPPGMDGTWDLVFNLAFDGKTITGDAMLTMSNGTDFLFLVKGKVKNGLAAIGLKGDPSDPAAKAVKIKASIRTLEGEQAAIELIKGKAFGQTLAW